MKLDEIENFVKQSLDSAPQNFRDQVNWLTYIQECRTVVFGLPRQTGKTTIAQQYVRNKSALMVVQNSMMVRYVGGMPYIECNPAYQLMSFDAFSRLPDNFRGRGKHQMFGLKFQCLVFDEVHLNTQTMKDVYSQTLWSLYDFNMLTDDFHIVHFKTPTSNFV